VAIHVQSPADPIERFRRAVLDAPDRAAVRGEDGELTFAELDRRSAGLAGALGARGIETGDPVGVCLGRGVRLVVALLAVWRCGAAYVPLDPRYPRERLEYMADDSALRVVIGSTRGAGPAFAISGVEVVDPDETTASPGPAARRPAGPLDPAYVIYTSGSTGRPKGVQVTRGGVANLIAALEWAGVYAAEPRVVGWNASMSFDASVKQWIRVCRGDTVVVLGEERRTDAAGLKDFLEAHAVQDLDLTPSHWELMKDGLPDVRGAGRPPRLLMGGEPVPPAVWAEIAAASAAGRIEAVNLYGPTECTVDATAAWIAGAGPHIGAPLPGTRVYVLDDTLRRVGAQEAGELYLAGAGLAVGYLNRPALTAERFVADPFGAAGVRMYRTGDRVRRRGDGALEFLGRVDRQVKIRGHRVELGEVEAAVAAHPHVVTAVATARGGELAAYYVAHRPPAPDLRAYCTETLPSHLVPSAFVEVEQIPLTVNGKVDWEALPAPGATRTGPAVEPSGAYEELIAGVWAEVLDRGQISADDDFFALGGHSLVALRVVARLKKQLGVSVPTREVYRHPRLRDLAAYVEARRAAPEGSRS
jgi:amino acid adenylation domain-containing protein